MPGSVSGFTGLHVIFLGLMRLVAVAMFVALAGGVAQEPVGTGSVAGRVVDSISGDAIAGANVIVAGMSLKAEGRAQAGPDGIFRVEGLPAGSFFLTAYAERYLPPDTSPTAIVEVGQERAGIVLSLRPTAIIRGSVLEESGKPVAGATVRALVERHESGMRQVRVVKTGVSDAAGQYKLDGLTASKYYVVAQDSKDGIRTYLPGTTSADEAQPVQLNFGQEYAGADVRLRTMALHRVQGRIHGLDELPRGQEAKLNLRPQNTRDADVFSREAKITDGGFQFDGVQPGNYILLLEGTSQAGASGSGSQAMFVHVLAKQDLQVAQNDINNMSLVVSATATVTGRVVLEHGTAREFAATQVDLRPAESFSFSDYKSVRAGTDGAFVITGCDPARHSLHILPPAGTYLEQIEYNRQVAATRVLDFPNGTGGELVIKLQRGPASFSGTLANGVKSALVLLIPADWTQDDWHEVMYKPAGDGSFSFTGVRPGKYVAVTTEWLHRDRRELQDPEVLQALLREGQAVELSPGMQKNLELTVLSESTVSEIMGRIGL